jgi:hypothetical protein
MSKKSAAEKYTVWHWGVGPVRHQSWSDPDYPKGEVIECGRLVELRVKENGKRSLTHIKLTNAEANGSHLGFDPHHKYERLYVFSHPDFASKMRQKYGARANPGSAPTLNELAERAGGHHALRDYPKVRAADIGELRHVIYACEKKGDGYSFYIHEMGEEGGVKPRLCVDGKGRCWIVGGDYRVLEPGITN